MTTAAPAVFSLFDEQYDFVHDKSPYSAAVAGIGSGKTLGGADKTTLYIADNAGAPMMVTAPTYKMLTDATLVSLEQELSKLGRNFYTLNKAEMTIQTRTGSKILLRSTDNPDSLRGPNLAAIWMDEAAQSSEEAFKILQGRLREPGYPHQLWITTTPKGFNWVYHEFAKEQREDYKLHHWPTWRNPYLTEQFIRQLRESYEGEWADQELEGLFVLVGGQLFFETESLKAQLLNVQDPIEKYLGAIEIWKHPTTTGRYVAGGDLAWGETGAYSCLTISDWRTGEEMAEIHGRLKAEEMAKQTVALCNHYNKAFALMEANSEGMRVVEIMVELGYSRRMFHRNDEPGEGRMANQNRRTPKKPGWYTTGGNRLPMLDEYGEALREGATVVRSRAAVEEMMQFARDDRGKPGPTQGSRSDRVMSRALMWQARKYANWLGVGDSKAVSVPMAF